MKNEYSYILERLTSLKKLRNKILEEINSELADISKTEYVLMHKICNRMESLNMSDLSESTGYSNAIITLTVDGLESKGYVKRTRGSDRRSYLVKLTDNGKKKCGEIKILEKKITEAVFENMSKEDLSSLMDILKKLDDLIARYV
ncbi:MAG: MarR family transcriptional regulator [Thermoplasmatales archaeon]|nr:MarR family transcriptional regulator [Thermoplasmatales archaeon]